ncbi:MAG TPA: S49 family peptidase [Alphaproteobacteria bacterium]|nr:S49 family peptidase [Alphaproteobacteria bacterium]
MGLGFLPFIPKPPIVAVIRLTGMISPTPQVFRGNLNLAGLVQQIERAGHTRGVRAIALQVNSPGGSPVQSELIAKRLRAVARESDLPLFAFVEDIAASGGYWLACAADEIYAERSSLIGSIGVVSSGFGFTEAIERHGIERRVHAQGRHKAMLDPFRPENAADVARLEGLQKEIHQAFKDHVRDRRGKRLKGEDDRLFEGDVWTGEGALALGLIDGIGDMRTVMRDRFGKKVQLCVMGPRKSWFRRRLGMSRAPTFDLDPHSVISGVFTAMEERALWARFGL